MVIYNFLVSKDTLVLRFKWLVMYGGLYNHFNVWIFMKQFFLISRCFPPVVQIMTMTEAHFLPFLISWLFNSPSLHPGFEEQQSSALISCDMLARNPSLCLNQTHNNPRGFKAWPRLFKMTPKAGKLLWQLHSLQVHSAALTVTWWERELLPVSEWNTV